MAPPTRFERAVSPVTGERFGPLSYGGMWPSRLDSNEDYPINSRAYYHCTTRGWCLGLDLNQHRRALQALALHWSYPSVVAVTGLEPIFPGSKPGVLPIRRLRIGSPGLIRTSVARFRAVNPTARRPENGTPAPICTEMTTLERWRPSVERQRYGDRGRSRTYKPLRAPVSKTGVYTVPPHGRGTP